MAYSLPAVKIACDWLNKNNFYAVVYETKIRPHVSLRHEYADDGDILLLGPKDVEGKIIEVKRYGPENGFTSPEDHRFKSVLLDNHYNILRDKHHYVYAYIIVNPPMTHGFVFSINTQCHWEVRYKVWSKTDKEYKDLVYCEKKYITQVITF